MAGTRERIREAALKLFIDKGFRDTSIADIERAAGLAPRAGTFYRHFASKAALAVEIGETSIIETRTDLGFDGVLPLGDTRAELVLIAKGYLKAAERQAPLADFISEVRYLPEIQDLERRVNRDLLDAMQDWLADKPFARGKSDHELAVLALNVIGGWVFYLSKRGSPTTPAEFTDAFVLEEWAGLWAGVLDDPKGPGG